MPSLSKFNQVMDSQGSIDAGLRLISHSCLLVAEMLEVAGLGKDYAHFIGMMVEIFAKFTEARFINRIFLTPRMIQGFLNASSPEDKAKAASMVVFFPLEHSWWLSTLTHSINHYVPFDADKMSQNSVRCWAFFVLVDLHQQLKALEELKRTGSKKQVTRQKLRLQGCACDLVLAIQYSSARRPFPDTIINIAGAYGGLIGLYLQLSS